jgi:hypothetical protein
MRNAYNILVRKPETKQIEHLEDMGVAERVTFK